MNKNHCLLGVLAIILAFFIPVYSVVNVRMEKSEVENIIRVEIRISETDLFQDTVSINKGVTCIRFSDFITEYTKNLSDTIYVSLLNFSGYYYYIDSISFPVDSESLKISYKEYLSNAGIAIGEKKILAKPHPNSLYNKKIKLSIIEGGESTFINNTVFFANDKLESVAKASISGEYLNDSVFADYLSKIKDLKTITVYSGNIIKTEDLADLKRKSGSFYNLTRALSDKPFLKDARKKANVFSHLLHCVPGCAFFVFLLPAALEPHGAMICLYGPIILAVETGCILGIPVSSMLFEKMLNNINSEKNKATENHYKYVYEKTLEIMNSEITKRQKEKEYKILINALIRPVKEKKREKYERIIF
ncbi:TPA: hypothetical protein DCW38_08130 [candidate division WOR-3 bacterium]|uniref:Uncharacterized protein n=1 Tax=candidate division WOR-3 bacterium TaxID=2052148 RepID=A0A350HC63_UNCW3|nr:hypothetical protein [candidate division WOR-3 bacterium]